MAVHMIKFQSTDKPIYMHICTIRYVFGPQAELESMTRPGWCYHCRAFKYCESPLSLEELDEEIESLHDPNSESRIWYSEHHKRLRWEIFGNQSIKDAEAELESYIAQIIEDMRQRRKWYATRMSPPKCLSCGSTNLLLFPCGEEVKSPCSEGTLIWYDIQVRDGKILEPVYLTPEGDRLKLRNLQEHFRKFLHRYGWLRQPM